MNMMGITALILAGGCISLTLALIVAVLVVWMQNRQENAAYEKDTHRGDSLPLPNRSSPDPSTPSIDSSQEAGLDSLEEQARALVRAGNKIEAIRVVRAATGLGLADAKKAVDALEHGERAPMQPGIFQEINDLTGEARIRELIASGNKIVAIKTYREMTGSDLLAAKNAVEAIEREMKAGGGQI